MQDNPKQFPGFPPEMKKNFWMFPRLLDSYMHLLNGSETRVLLFILRRTWGFQKNSDTMSIEQIANGGGKIGTGTGLSYRQVVTSLHKLEDKGFITIRTRKGWTSEYTLVLQQVQAGGEKSGSTPLNEVQALSNEQNASTIDSKAIEKKIEKMYTLYSNIIRSGQRLTREAKENIKARFNEYWPEELVCALKNVRENEYWKGIAETQTVAWFFSSEERVAQFLALGPYEWSKNSES